ncbi:helix-turn-helix transcriptional regulator [Kitasatospora sp. NPDC001664]
MNESVAATATSTRDLDRILRPVHALIVTTAALTTGPDETPGSLPAVQRLLLRALSDQIPCVLVVPDSTHPLPLLSRWPMVVNSGAAMGNPFATAARMLDLPGTACMAVCGADESALALAGGVPVTVADEHGMLGALAARPVVITKRQTRLVLLMAGGSSSEEAADKLGVTPQAARAAVSYLHRQIGTEDRAHLLAHCLVHGLVDTTGLRAKLPAQPPVLTEEQTRVLTLSITIPVSRLNRPAGMSHKRATTTLASAVASLGATSRHHAVALAVLYGIIPATAVPAPRPTRPTRPTRPAGGAA